MSGRSRPVWRLISAEYKLKIPRWSGLLQALVRHLSNPLISMLQPALLPGHTAFMPTPVLPC
jgi:hypothetical protein